MSTTNSKIRDSRTVIIAAFSMILALGTALAAPRAFSQSTSSQSGKIGEIRLDKYVTLRFEPPPQPGATAVSLAGPDLSISSPRYRMAAPRIRLTFKSGRLSTGAATGGVQVTVKDDVTNQTTQVNCSTATYTGGATTSRGRIDLKGTVRTKTYSPNFAQPLVSESESGFIEFTGSGSPTVQLNNGSASVTPIEPPAAPAKKP